MQSTYRSHRTGSSPFPAPVLRQPVVAVARLNRYTLLRLPASAVRRSRFFPVVGAHHVRLAPSFHRNSASVLSRFKEAGVPAFSNFSGFAQPALPDQWHGSGNPVPSLQSCSSMSLLFKGNLKPVESHAHLPPLRVVIGVVRQTFSSFSSNTHDPIEINPVPRPDYFNSAHINSHRKGRRPSRSPSGRIATAISGSVHYVRSPPIAYFQSGQSGACHISSCARSRRSWRASGQWCTSIDTVLQSSIALWACLTVQKEPSERCWSCLSGRPWLRFPFRRRAASLSTIRRLTPIWHAVASVDP